MTRRRGGRRCCALPGNCGAGSFRICRWPHADISEACLRHFGGAIDVRRSTISGAFNRARASDPVRGTFHSVRMTTPSALLPRHRHCADINVQCFVASLALRIMGADGRPDLQMRHDHQTGRTRMSSVFGLKVRPRRAIALAGYATKSGDDLFGHRDLALSLTATTDSTMRVGAPLPAPCASAPACPWESRSRQSLAWREGILHQCVRPARCRGPRPARHRQPFRKYPPFH